MDYPIFNVIYSRMTWIRFNHVSTTSPKSFALSSPNRHPKKSFLLRPSRRHAEDIRQVMLSLDIYIYTDMHICIYIYTYGVCIYRIYIYTHMYKTWCMYIYIIYILCCKYEDIYIYTHYIYSWDWGKNGRTTQRPVHCHRNPSDPSCARTVRSYPAPAAVSGPQKVVISPKMGIPPKNMKLKTATEGFHHYSPIIVLLLMQWASWRHVDMRSTVCSSIGMVY